MSSCPPAEPIASRELVDKRDGPLYYWRVVKVDVGAVLEAGREVELQSEVPLPDFGAYRFPKPALVALDLSRVGRSLAIDGTIDATYGGECERCLSEVDRTLHLTVEEKIDANPWDPAEADPFAEEAVLSGTLLDVDDLVRQLVTAALPIVNLCTDECAGLCARCAQTPGVCQCRPHSGELHGQS
jgi:uncharacterized protein